MKMHSGNWKCQLPGCAFDAEPDLTNKKAHEAFVMHLKYIHGIPRNGDNSPIMFENFDPKTKGYKVDNGVPIKILASVELELDKYIKIAMEWKDPEGGIWNSNEVAKLRNELEKAKASAAGRGLAIAIWHMRGGDSTSNPFTGPDHVIRDAVDRWLNPVPEDSNMGISPSEQASPASGGNTSTLAPKKATGTKLDDEQRVRIAEALESGFDSKTLSAMFKTSVEEIEACRAVR